MRRAKVSNDALIAALESVRPPELSRNDWLARAGFGHSYIDDLGKGVQPNVYYLEALVAVVGLKLSDFWRIVEEERARRARFLDDGGE